MIVLFYGLYTNFICTVYEQKTDWMHAQKNQSLYSTCKMHAILYLAADFLIM